jgi:hypothetical protein
LLLGCVASEHTLMPRYVSCGVISNVNS